jgi:hypothetical protein
MNLWLESHMGQCTLLMPNEESHDPDHADDPFYATRRLRCDVFRNCVRSLKTQPKRHAALRAAQTRQTRRRAGGFFLVPACRRLAQKQWRLPRRATRPSRAARQRSGTRLHVQ